MPPQFFFPDSVDVVDPAYDFLREAYSPAKVRQRREAYPHEVLRTPPYDGLLVSMAMAGFRAGTPGRAPSRYTEAQRFRLLYSGVRRFFRLDDGPTAAGQATRLLTMGDTGAYAYAYQDAPPITASDALDFYERVGFDFGLAPDHIVPGFQPSGPIPEAWRRRRNVTLDLAADFLAEHRARGARFTPLGVAQGWSPDSYAESVRRLQAMGYDYVALGGLAPLGSRSIQACLDAVARVRKPSTRLHLLGLARSEYVTRAAAYGVASIDTTMPLRQAFKDDKHNYHTADGHYLALRVPSWEGNPRLERRVREAGVPRRIARVLERTCLDALRRYDRGEAPLEEPLDAVRAYERLFNGRDQTPAYRALLEDRPWTRCPCAVCTRLGIEVVLFRGAERNRRRGFHNLYVFHRSLQQATTPHA